MVFVKKDVGIVISLNLENVTFPSPVLSVAGSTGIISAQAIAVHPYVSIVAKIQSFSLQRVYSTNDFMLVK